MFFAKLVEGFLRLLVCTGKFGKILWGLLYVLSLVSFAFFFFVFVTCYENIMILNIIQYEMEILFFFFLPECVTHKSFFFFFSYTLGFLLHWFIVVH